MIQQLFQGYISNIYFIQISQDLKVLELVNRGNFMSKGSPGVYNIHIRILFLFDFLCIILIRTVSTPSTSKISIGLAPVACW